MLINVLRHSSAYYESSRHFMHFLSSTMLISGAFLFIEIIQEHMAHLGFRILNMF